MISRRLARPTRLLWLVPALVAGTGCVTQSDIEGLHRQMNDIEREIQTVENKSSSKEEIARLNSGLTEQTSQLLKSNADTGVRLDQLSRAIEALEAKLDDTNRRLAELSQQIAATQGDLSRVTPAGPVGVPQPNAPASAPPAAPPSGPSASPAAGPTPQQLYDTAYGDYTRGRYELSIAGFQDYISRYPNTDLSDNAQYWIAESEYAEKKYEQAIRDFDALLKRWPDSDKAPAALLKKGYALDELNRRAEAIVALQYVVHEYPASDEARLARQKLKTWRVSGRD